MSWREKILIGTSGRHYDHWKASFYPPELEAGEFLDFYRRYLSTVEINNSFYSLPEKVTLREWRRKVPSDFVFSAKASRYLTHMKKLKDPTQPLTKFLERMKTLGDQLGPVLFQLPPRWRVNMERLARFLDVLPEIPAAFEFRDPSWFCQELYSLLEERRAAFCIYDLAGELSPLRITSDLVYVRLHGPEEAYSGKYARQTLAGWAGRLSSWARQEREVYCYFDNDEAGFAPQNARELH